MRYHEIIKLIETTSPSKSYLAGLVAHDQKSRNQFKSFVSKYPSWEAGTQAWIKQRNVSPDDVFNEKASLMQFMRQAQTFQYQVFDDDDWNNFWLLSQHCDFDRTFQRQALKTIQQYQGSENSHYKYLYDRISCGTSGTQKYGTQDLCNIDE